MLAELAQVTFIFIYGTGFFVVYNDRRDTSTLDPHEVLGRSFIVKYTRLIDF